MWTTVRRTVISNKKLCNSFLFPISSYSDSPENLRRRLSFLFHQQFSTGCTPLTERVPPPSVYKNYQLRPPTTVENISYPVPGVNDDFADEANYTRLAQNLVKKQHSKWTPNRFTIFYDGSCPLCSREIQHYKNISNNSGDSSSSSILFLDLFDYTQLTTVSSLLQTHKIKLEDARKRIHVITENEQVYHSAEAFREIWRRMPYWRMIVPIIDNEPAMKVANVVYAFWAEKRWKNRMEMDDSKSCSLKSKNDEKNEM